MRENIPLEPEQKIKMPRIEPPPRVEFDLDGSAQWLKRMAPPFTPKCEFICTLEWSWTRKESYLLRLKRTTTIGVGGISIAKARYVWKDYDWHGAAMILLAQLLAGHAHCSLYFLFGF